MASDSTYLSMTELARRLDLPESTMRYYCKRFAKFLPYKGEGRRRRYAPECEKTLVFIANAMHRNKNATAVELMLQSGQFTPGLAVQQFAAPVAQAAAAPQEAGLGAESARLLISIMERQADALGKISERLAAFVERLEAAPPAPAAAQVEGGNFGEELLSLKQQMFTAEKMHQEDLEQLRKWLGRISEAVARLGS